MGRTTTLLPRKYREYLYHRCLNSDYRNESKQYAYVTGVYSNMREGDDAEEIENMIANHCRQSEDLRTMESKFVVREDLSVEIIENIFANLDLLAHRVMQKYRCGKKVAYSLTCYIFSLLFSTSTIDVHNGLSKETFKIMEKIFECGYYGEKFDDSQFPILRENYNRYGRYYEEEFLENLNYQIRKIYYTFNAEYVF